MKVRQGKQDFLEKLQKAEKLVDKFRIIEEELKENGPSYALLKAFDKLASEKSILNLQVLLSNPEAKLIDFLANSLTQRSRELFVQDLTNELHQLKQEDKKKRQTPHYDAIEKNANRIGDFIQLDIVNRDSLSESLVAIKRWIAVMSQCLKQNDFHSVFIISNVLNSAMVARLRNSGDFIADNALLGKAERKILKKADSLTDPRGNFKNFRKKMEEVMANRELELAIPFLGGYKAKLIRVGEEQYLSTVSLGQTGEEDKKIKLIKLQGELRSTPETYLKKALLLPADAISSVSKEKIEMILKDHTKIATLSYEDVSDILSTLSYAKMVDEIVQLQERNKQVIVSKNAYLCWEGINNENAIDKLQNIPRKFYFLACFLPEAQITFEVRIQILKLLGNKNEFNQLSDQEATDILGILGYTMSCFLKKPVFKFEVPKDARFQEEIEKMREEASKNRPALTITKSYSNIKNAAPKYKSRLTNNFIEQILSVAEETAKAFEQAAAQQTENRAETTHLPKQKPKHTTRFFKEKNQSVTRSASHQEQGRERRNTIVANARKTRSDTTNETSRKMSVV